MRELVEGLRESLASESNEIVYLRENKHFPTILNILGQQAQQSRYLPCIEITVFVLQEFARGLEILRIWSLSYEYSNDKTYLVRGDIRLKFCVCHDLHILLNIFKNGFALLEVRLLQEKASNVR